MRFARTVMPALIALAASMGPAQAGPEEIAFLQSYVGDWRGDGKLVNADQSEDFTCRVEVSRGNQGNIRYAGNCRVAGLPLSVAGTIAYVDAARHYEAVMSSNTDFRGWAVGRKQGKDSVLFDLKAEDTSVDKTAGAIGAKIELRGANIMLSFEYASADSASTADATVTFSKRN